MGNIDAIRAYGMILHKGFGIPKNSTEAVRYYKMTIDKGPSTFPVLYNSLTKTEIEDIIESFRKSAVQSQKAGVDGVQLHGAHGYLFSSFMSPFYNHRDDEYGCNDEGRIRFVLETAEAIRKSC